MAGAFTPARSAFTRVHITEGRARADHEPDFKSCVKAQSYSQSFGDIEKIECPDPNRFGAFIEVGKIQGAIERGAIDLMGRYASDIASELLRIAKKRCATDVHVNFGACSDPRNNNVFTKKIILADASLGNWNTEDLGALSSDENAVVNESTSLSVGEIFEVLALSFTRRGDDIVTNPVVDVVVCDRASCGDCDPESDGCEKVYAVTLASPGSPGTAPDVVYSLDKGVNWAADDVNTLSAAQDADGIACVDENVVVISEDSESHHYKPQADVDSGVVAGWTEVTGGYVAGNGPLDIWSVGNFAFVVGENGYIYGMADPTAAVTVLDAGIASSNNLNAVHALSDMFSVAVGDSDDVVFTVDRVTWTAATATGGGGNLLCVWAKNQDEWWVGDDNGDLWYTLDRGVTWTQKLIPVITNPSQINDISFASNSMGAISGERTTTRGFALRTYDGGYSWLVLPEGSGSLPLSDSLDAHALCSDDINWSIFVGLADDAADGLILVGND